VSLSAHAFTPRSLWRGFSNISAYRNNRLDWLLRTAAEAGDIGSYLFGPWSGVIVNSPEYAHAILSEHADAFEKLPSFVFLKPLLGNGLLTSEHEQWRRQRKLAAPAFQHRRIAAYAQAMAEHAERAQQRWADGAQIDVASEMMRLTLGIVGKTLFDADVGGEAEAVRAALTTALHYVDAQTSTVLPTPPTWPTPRNLRNRRAIARLDAIIYRLIAERRATGHDTGDLLSMLLQARDEEDGSGMSDHQVRDEAMTIFLAGHETTAVGLAWAWYLLAQNPLVYGRLREEATRVLAGRTPTYADLEQLPYALQVFKEAMRLYPPAYVIGRYAIRDVDLGDYVLPAKTWVIISPYTLHRRSEYFPDPERFDPDRFTAANERRLPRYAYIPFGGGPRVCIGNHFALMEGQIILAALAQRVAFDLVPGQRIGPRPLITLRPRDRITMQVQR
jgi:cytochrome P450